MTFVKVFAVLLAIVIAGLAWAWHWLSAVPQLRPFAEPPPSHWIAKGPRMANPNPSAVIPLPDGFHTMHGSTVNSDELWTAVAPSFVADWIAEEKYYIAEGPTYDNAGNLLFSPSWAPDDVSLVALDRLTGKRRWAIPGKGSGSGAPLVLNDPEQIGKQLIYHSTYTKAMALRADGSIVWTAPTGLTLPAVQSGVRSQTHVWGMNYHPQADALLAVTMDGWVIAHDRRTGESLLAEPFHLPGAPAITVAARVPKFLARLANRETDTAFGPTDDGLGLFTSVLDIIYGNGVNVANFYAIDPINGSILIAATAPDEQDGKQDGVSDNGALYRLELSGDKPGNYKLRIVDRYYFSGGTGSTPTVSADGALVVVSDDNGNIITLDQHLKELWRVNVGDQVAASIAVAADANEMFAVTKTDIIKLHHDGKGASIVWRAKLDAYPGFLNVNALTPTITANGIVISIGAGRQIRGTQFLTKFGMGLLDRETGELRWFAEGREESIAVTSVGPDGSIYIAHSPIRRALMRGLFGDSLPPLVGGIQRYKPLRHDLLARDAICAASTLSTRLNDTPANQTASQRDDRLQIALLLKQAALALPTALSNGELTAAKASELSVGLDQALAQLNEQRAPKAMESMNALCHLSGGH